MDIQSKKFQEWTKGKNKLNARISIYNHIRNIPYNRVQGRNLKTELCLMLNKNKGTCNEKHILLSKMYELLGIQTRYVSHLFRWSDLPVKYPTNLIKLARKMPICDHLFCQAFIRGKWISIDSTWDLSLKKANFPVNEAWDGFSNTLNAVIPLSKIIHKSLEERIRQKRELVSKYNQSEIAIQPIFYESFNKWLSSLRKKD